MSRFESEEEIEGPEDLVTRAFSRCSNWPKERLGIIGLAQALKKVSDRIGVPMTAIVARCAESSPYCPTDADLLTAARDVVRLDAVAAGTFDSTANSTNSIGRKRCPLCDGTGFEIIYTLHTLRSEHSDWRYAERKNITEDEARKIEKSTAWPTKAQRIYSGARPCSECRQVAS